VAAPFLSPVLDRSELMEADLRFVAGDSWKDRVLPNAVTSEYCERLREVGFRWAGGLVAHHYVTYLGDLSGGVQIRAALERALDLGPGRGTSAYYFDQISDYDAFKRAYRAALDAAPWDAAERDRILDEILLAYDLNGRLLEALG
jgi:heme oxygenase